MNRYTLVFTLFDQLLVWGVALVFLLPLKQKPRSLAHGLLCAVLCTALRFAGSVLLPPSHGFWVEQLLDVFFVLLIFWSCADIPRKAVPYCAIWVMILSQFIQQLCGNLYILLGRHAPWSPLGRVMFCLLVGLVLYAVVGLTLARLLPDHGSYQIGPRQLTAAVVSVLAFEVLSLNFGYLWQQNRQSADWPVLILMEMYCITLMYLQHEMFKKSALRHEVALLNQLHDQQRAQYDLSKENIALINRKCHDLKHQVQAMRLMGQDAAREKYLQEMENAIRIYGAIVTTGNEVLDTVLTEKSLYCEAHSIQAHCVADGRLLDFMDPVDLYTIFGNAMDNAIESVKHLHQKEQRIIDVLVYRENQMLVIQITNPIGGQLTFNEEGLPQSTKKKDGYHGFGLKSMRHTVAQYDGFLSVSVENGCFCLRILLPIQQKN